jgi:hypothetical protein
MTRSTNNPHRHTILFTVGKRTVPQSEGLVGDLLSGLGVSSSIACIDDYLAEVLVVFIAARKDYRLGTFILTSGDTSLTMPVYLSFRQLRARGEEATGRIACDVSEDSVGHFWITPLVSTPAKLSLHTKIRLSKSAVTFLQTE